MAAKPSSQTGMMIDSHTLQLANKITHPYKIVRSKRAKYIRIKLSPHGELSLVIPNGISEIRAHQFIESKTAWIEKNLSLVEKSSKSVLPSELHLKFIKQKWQLDYINSSADELVLNQVDNKQLLISGSADKTNSYHNVHKILQEWLKKKARPVLSRELSEIAEEFGFHFNRLSIRAQKTRWGSCSNKKNISLNCKLLFMPEDIVRYVLIHELCHTLEMNHSSRFWALVEECDPEYNIHRKNLHSIAKHLPF